MRTDDLALLSIEAVKKLTEGDIQLFGILKHQLDTSTIKEIDFDGYGFYTEFGVDEQYQIMNPALRSLDISDLVGLNRSGECSVGFVLFVSDGMITTLEGFPFLSDEWPLEDIRFMYTEQPHGCNAKYVEKRSSSFYEKYDQFGTVYIKGCMRDKEDCIFSSAYHRFHPFL